MGFGVLLHGPEPSRFFAFTAFVVSCLLVDHIQRVRWFIEMFDDLVVADVAGATCEHVVEREDGCLVLGTLVALPWDEGHGLHLDLFTIVVGDGVGLCQEAETQVADDGKDHPFGDASAKVGDDVRVVDGGVVG